MNFIAGILFSLSLFFIYYASQNYETEIGAVIICSLSGFMIGLILTIFMLAPQSKKRKKYYV